MSFLEIFGARDKSVRLDFMLDWMGSEEFFFTFSCDIWTHANFYMQSQDGATHLY